MPGLVFALILAELATALQHSPGPFVLHVPQDHPTIQEAVDAAPDTATILISAGTYPEAVTITGKVGVKLMGKGKVIIDPPGDTTAITLDGCTDCTLTKLRVTGSTNGIDFRECEGGGAFKCRVEDVTANGISLLGSLSVKVEKCTIMDTGGEGIDMAPIDLTQSVSCDVLKCKIYRAGDEGVDIEGSENIVEDTLVVEPAGDGMRVASSPQSQDNTLTRNKIVKPGGFGFFLQGTDNTVRQSKVLQGADNGIQIMVSDSSTVQECKIVKCTFDGIFSAADSINVELLDNKFTKPGTNGIDVDGDGAEVEGNKCTGSLGNGYFILGNNGTWTGNKATGSANNGFELAGNDNVLTFNKGKGSKAGFDLSDQGTGNSIDETNKFKTVAP